jgi:hypothetical protein
MFACLLLSPFPVQAQKTVQKYHYWFDQTRQKEVTASYGDTEELTLSIATDGLTEGIHQLYMRFQDSSGAWSPLHGTMVFVRALPKNGEVKVVKAEYWIDNGNRQETNVSSDEVTFAVDASNMSEGLHTLNFRVKDNEGMYSPLQTWIFYNNTAPKATKIVWYKYWWNNYEDKAVKETLTGANAEYTFTKQLTVPDYAMNDGYSGESIARLNILFCDDQGHISPLQVFDVEYPDEQPPMTTIEADNEEVTESVTLTWTASESKIEDFNVYYSESGQPFVLWLPNTTKQTATFKGQAGKTYRFTVTARDKAGNREALDESKYAKVKFKSN